MSKLEKYISLFCRVVSALILFQTLFYKFSGSEESVYIFTMVGMEPCGRIGIGLMELAACILLFVPKYEWCGSILAVKLMAGALFFHVTKLGYEVQGDDGYLFWLAIAVFATSIVSFYLERTHVLEFAKKMNSKYKFINLQKPSL